MILPFTDQAHHAIPLYCTTAAEWAKQLSTLTAIVSNASGLQKFKGDHGHLLMLSHEPTPALYLGVKAGAGIWDYAEAIAKLPAHTYRLMTPVADDFMIAWAVVAYRFRALGAVTASGLTLLWPDKTTATRLTPLVQAIYAGRDLINTPANLLGVTALAAAVKQLAQTYGADCREIVGEALLTENYPLIHAVGKAGAEAPRLLDVIWGNPQHPKLTLVGKGVCYDTGGLNLKPGRGMRDMKKDMGGAAVLLQLAGLVMQQRLPVRLRLLIPIVENAISAAAMRPGDVFYSRAGKTVEIADTDAEGRLILADALAEADSENPALLINAATLTGATLVALGADFVAGFSRQPELISRLVRWGETLHDPIWALPLWEPYRPWLHSNVADMQNVAKGGDAGTIIAALFLADFVKATTPWLHLDMRCWNYSNRPGRPEGGEVSGLRALWALLQEKFGA